jgi:hypothetical protein
LRCLSQAAVSLASNGMGSLLGRAYLSQPPPIKLTSRDHLRLLPSCSSVTSSAGSFAIIGCLRTIWLVRSAPRSTCRTCKLGVMIVNNARDKVLITFDLHSFNDDPLPADILTTREPPWPELNLDLYLTTNSREARSPEILACARHLRARYPKLGTVGYCYGGWAGF